MNASIRKKSIRAERRVFETISVLFVLSLAQTAMAATAPALGAAGGFAVLGATTVSNVGGSLISGDLGNSPGITITGFPPGVVNGTIRANDATAAQAQIDATAAYNALVAQACTSGPLGATDLAGATLIPGIYCYSSTLQNSGLLTLDAQGNNNAVWIFKAGSTFTTLTGGAVSLINGGQVRNVFWQVGSSATLGANTQTTGSILALTSITLNTGAAVTGRALALTGAVTLDTNTVTLPPFLTSTKSVAVFSDPVNGTATPKAIPGSEIVYSIAVTNSDYGAVDNNTTVVTDIIPVNISLCVSTLCSNPPVIFSCGAVCGLTYTYATNVTYSNQLGGGAPYTYTAVADAAGYDANVTGVKINPTGVFSGIAGGVNASFSLALKMKVK
ncbi:MAG: ice-binding family protein [Gallionella sp.]|nr:ice-binding family protein [Gallionella sp.]MDD4959517.1 ice-binding family protein [Gallionella sp.]